MSKIMILAQQIDEEIDVEFGVVDDAYDMGVWVNRWFCISPLAVEVSENLYSIVLVYPSYIPMAHLANLVIDDLQQYIERLSFKTQKAIMVDDNILGSLK